MAFCDVRIFNPIAKSYLNQSLSAAHRRNENEKKRLYNERIINVDHGSFSPLVFTAMGGMSRECSRFYSQAAERLSEKRNVSKSIISCWLKTKLNFCLLRSCLMCVRGNPITILRTNENKRDRCSSGCKRKQFENLSDINFICNVLFIFS